MADPENRRSDDTGLADDLLNPTETQSRPGEESTLGSTAPAPPPRPRDPDDDFDPDDTGGRSRLTTGLIVAVIFVVGVFVGVLLGRVLTPTPPPQIVYILDDGGAPPPSASSATTPVSSPAPTG